MYLVCIYICENYQCMLVRNPFPTHISIHVLPTCQCSCPHFFSMTISNIVECCRRLQKGMLLLSKIWLGWTESHSPVECLCRTSPWKEGGRAAKEQEKERKPSRIPRIYSVDRNNIYFCSSTKLRTSHTRIAYTIKEGGCVGGASPSAIWEGT